MHKDMIRLVLAPTASGKSHLVASSPDLFVDGDTVISKSIGWPSIKQWWLTPGADHIAYSNWVALFRYAPRDKIVLFNNSPRTLKDAIFAYGHRVHIEVVAPLPDVMARNIALRAADKGGDHGQPTELATALSNRRHVLSWAKQNGNSIYLSWAEYLAAKGYKVPPDFADLGDQPRARAGNEARGE